MHRCRAGEQPSDDTPDADLPVEELERLALVDALLRVVAAHDRSDPITASGAQAAAPVHVDFPEARERGFARGDADTACGR
jgi:hypothetical protein